MTSFLYSFLMTLNKIKDSTSTDIWSRYPRTEWGKLQSFLPSFSSFLAVPSNNQSALYDIQGSNFPIWNEISWTPSYYSLGVTAFWYDGSVLLLQRSFPFPSPSGNLNPSVSFLLSCAMFWTCSTNILWKKI